MLFLCTALCQSMSPFNIEILLRYTEKCQFPTSEDTLHSQIKLKQATQSFNVCLDVIHLFAPFHHSSELS